MQRRSCRGDARRGPRIASLAPAAILAAGGRGERAGGAIPKQLREIAGRPLLIWSLDALRAAGCVPIVVVSPPGSIDEVGTLLGPTDLAVPGGETRRESVFAALQAIDAEVVVVHDAARPLVLPGMIAAVLAALDRANGAVLAAPVGETLKRSAGDEVIETLPREGLWTAQTPQAFKAAVLLKAHLEVPKDHPAPDDASLLEALGEAVVVVESHEINIKVTFPSDLATVEALLEARAKA